MVMRAKYKNISACIYSARSIKKQNINCLVCRSKMLIFGHTDSIVNDAYNLALSRSRAAKIMELLT